MKSTRPPPFLLLPLLTYDYSIAIEAFRGIWDVFMASFKLFGLKFKEMRGGGMKRGGRSSKSREGLGRDTL